jgi:hypothetical protein
MSAPVTSVDSTVGMPGRPLYVAIPAGGSHPTALLHRTGQPKAYHPHTPPSAPQPRSHRAACCEKSVRVNCKHVMDVTPQGHWGHATHNSKHTHTGAAGREEGVPPRPRTPQPLGRGEGRQGGQRHPAHHTTRCLCAVATEQWMEGGGGGPARGGGGEMAGGHQGGRSGHPQVLPPGPTPATPHHTPHPHGHPSPPHTVQEPLYSVFLRKEQPSVRRVLPPVGVHSSTEQLGHTTSVCAWLNTVVLHMRGRGGGGDGEGRRAHTRLGTTVGRCGVERSGHNGQRTHGRRTTEREQAVAPWGDTTRDPTAHPCPQREHPDPSDRNRQQLQRSQKTATQPQNTHARSARPRRVGSGGEKRACRERQAEQNMEKGGSTENQHTTPTCPMARSPLLHGNVQPKLPALQSLPPAGDTGGAAYGRGDKCTRPDRQAPIQPATHQAPNNPTCVWGGVPPAKGARGRLCS